MIEGLAVERTPTSESRKPIDFVRQQCDVIQSKDWLERVSRDRAALRVDARRNLSDETASLLQARLRFAQRALDPRRLRLGTAELVPGFLGFAGARIEAGVELQE